MAAPARTRVRAGAGRGLPRLADINRVTEGARRRRPVARMSYKRLRLGELVHVVDDFSRIACVELLPDERKDTCPAFMARHLGFFAGFGATVERVMPDK